MNQLDRTPTIARTYAPGRQSSVCHACLRTITDDPLFVRDEAYCCRGCADGHLCTCEEELSRAEDGVDGIGLPFLVGAGVATTA